jgi:hypothetical protein
MSFTNDLAVVSSRKFVFDDNGIPLNSKRMLEQAGAKGHKEYSKWHISIIDRSQRVPLISIKHIHASFLSIKHSYTMNSIDTLCICGKTFPQNIIEDAISMMERSTKTKLYSGIELAGINTRKDLKYLAEDWYLDKRDKEVCLFHICNENHPAYLYYGKGIPLKYIAWPPRPNCCKTCNKEIPKGVRIALLMMNQKAELK